jgi:hypothetical protein
MAARRATRCISTHQRCHVLITLIALGGSGIITADMLKLFVLGLPALAIGTWVGWKLYGKLDETSSARPYSCSSSFRVWRLSYGPDGSVLRTARYRSFCSIEAQRHTLVQSILTRHCCHSAKGRTPFRSRALDRLHIPCPPAPTIVEGVLNRIFGGSLRIHALHQEVSVTHPPLVSQEQGSHG